MDAAFVMVAAVPMQTVFPAVPAAPSPAGGRRRAAGRGGRSARGPVAVPSAEPLRRRCAEAFAKTSICRFYPWCQKGASCPFAHAEEELRARPDMAKTRMCAGYYDGRCKLPSHMCSFAHGEHELRERTVPIYTDGDDEDDTTVGAGSSVAGWSTVSGIGSGSSTPTRQQSGDGADILPEAPPPSPAAPREGLLPHRQSQGGDEHVPNFDLHAYGLQPMMSQWLQHIRYLTHSSLDVPTTEECIAVLRKAEPECYED